MVHSAGVVLAAGHSGAGTISLRLAAQHSISARGYYGERSFCFAERDVLPAGAIVARATSDLTSCARWLVLRFR